ncbi:MAG: hypothetical protein IJY70_04720 [Clostridia bacterium]|nr:hypothetical protein [Clostridia bacterium]
MERIEIKQKNELNREIFDNALFVHISSGGAMGCPGQVVAITKSCARYSFSYVAGEITYDDFAEVFPAVTQFSAFFDDAINIPQGWKYIYLGFGNFLLIADEVYGEFCEQTKDYAESYKIYGKWEEIAENIITAKFN